MCPFVKRKCVANLRPRSLQPANVLQWNKYRYCEHCAADDNGETLEGKELTESKRVDPEEYLSNYRLAYRLRCLPFWLSTSCSGLSFRASLAYLRNCSLTHPTHIW